MIAIDQRGKGIIIIILPKNSRDLFFLPWSLFLQMAVSHLLLLSSGIGFDLIADSSQFNSPRKKSRLLRLGMHLFFSLFACYHQRLRILSITYLCQQNRLHFNLLAINDLNLKRMAYFSALSKYTRKCLASA